MRAELHTGGMIPLVTTHTKGDEVRDGHFRFVGER